MERQDMVSDIRLTPKPKPLFIFINYFSFFIFNIYFLSSFLSLTFIHLFISLFTPTSLPLHPPISHPHNFHTEERLEMHAHTQT
ncbi:MAG: hypothetical protein ABUK18_10465, partial [Candidatus Bathyarchaeia archaeon]